MQGVKAKPTECAIVKSEKNTGIEECEVQVRRSRSAEELQPQFHSRGKWECALRCAAARHYEHS